MQQTRSIGYDSASATLEVVFKSGHTYQYTGVPAEVHDKFMAAPSHGKYFHAHVKDRYPTSQVA
ncbi:KTSC domain-containing protein [Lentzea aerocolonigenes]|uniref:KTSC domain-containing protein n=1 Tax=Lentzea aerocolonigenes TaxID=68170 RepID=UPI0004C34D57|nr:KTSC domain-containing protein [Lentzea aerocolonigenes]MCP2242708.1 KTSC domain-containing protein [Lentzea aerocolonigenes]